MTSHGSEAKANYSAWSARSHDLASTEDPSCSHFLPPGSPCGSHSCWLWISLSFPSGSLLLQNGRTEYSFCLEAFCLLSLPGKLTFNVSAQTPLPPGDFPWLLAKWYRSFLGCHTLITSLYHLLLGNITCVFVTIWLVTRSSLSSNSHEDKDYTCWVHHGILNTQHNAWLVVGP